MRVVLFAMPGLFALAVLPALLEAGVEVVGLALPAPPHAAPLTRLPAMASAADLTLIPTAPSLAQLAGAAGVALWGLRGMGQPAVAAWLAEQRADLACVACWPWRLPPALLALPRHGFLNLHPSPLPALRGPEPLFWAFRLGLEQSAVTLHQLDAGLDSGPIIAQAALALPLGISGPQAEAQAAALGAALLSAAIGAFAQGAPPPAQPQPPGGSFYPAPSAADFAIAPDWPARQAFHFMRGTAHWGLPYAITLPNRTLRLGTALGYDPVARLTQPAQIDGAMALLQLNPGVLSASVAHL